MKKNLPVTNIEIPVGQEQLLVSKTDLKGVITYCNETFVAISGFTRDELVGKSHNLVRHPDMPPQAFKDLWSTVQSGRPWRGLVKNRTKQGDYYWVEANVIPVTKNDQVIAYMSVRTTASREQIAAAEALYQRLNQSPNTTIPHPGKRIFSSLRSRLIAFTAIALAFVILTAIVGLKEISENQRALQAAYREQADPAIAVQETLALMDGAYKHVALGIMHHPGSNTEKLHTHPIKLHLDSIADKAEQIKALRPIISQRPANDAEALLMQSFIATTNNYIEQALIPAQSALETGNFDKAATLMENTLYPLYEEAKKHAKSLNKNILDDKAASEQKIAYRLEKTASTFGGITFVALITISLFSLWMIRSVVKQMKQAIRHFRRISEGILTDQVDIGQSGEFGEIFASLAVMQTNIKVMLDNIHSSVKMLLQCGADLDAQMYMVTMQSQLQQDQVQGVAATTEEFSQAVVEVADSAQQTASKAQESEKLVEICNASITQSMQANELVVSTVNDSSRIISELSSSINKIGDVTSTIKEIADQTNLLALNAAIEAARAGEAGRGFSVVADEVRKLSESTAHSTRDISALVGEIQAIASHAVAAMNKAVAEVGNGVVMMQSGSKDLTQITEASRAVNDMSQHIASAAHQQAVAGESVASSMETVAAMAEQNSQVAQQAMQLSKDLMKTAERLKKSLGKFEIFSVRTAEATVTVRAPVGEFIEM